GSWESWLVKGAYILMGFALLLALWWLGGLTESAGLIQMVAIPTALFAAGTAGYTAFLFGQCEGRDLWQTPLLLPTLLAQAVTAGGATYAIADLFMVVPEVNAIRWTLLGGAIATGALVWVELSSKGTPHVEAAIYQMTTGEYRKKFFTGVVLGLLIPGALVITALSVDSGPGLPAIAGIAALIGLWAYEDSFVRAGQSVPLS
ncbi:MAG: NrfD/PsrC family molybdoenzyme membrane anchor subunit, partial [Acidimicrobiales bacterium]